MSSLPAADLDRLTALVTPRHSGFGPFARFPKQAAFLLLPHFEVLYGGAAGGGKSAGLLLGALQYVDIPGYSALLLRRTFRDLSQPKALLSLSHEWLDDSAAKWSGLDRRWTFPSGATLTFGYLEHEADKLQYQGAELQFVGFDELTQFTETQYRYLLSRLRRLRGVEIPLRARAASNPGGPGHEWVFRYCLSEGPVADPPRPFLPAKLADNPMLDVDEYRKSLARLDPITRRQLEDGDWTIRASGNLFRREWFEVVDSAPATARRVRSWDFAATEATGKNDPDWTVGARVAEADGVWYIEDIRRIRGTPMAVEALVVQTAQTDGRKIEILIEVEGGSSGKTVLDSYQRRALLGFSVHGEHPTGPKVERWKPVSSAAEAGNVKLVRGAWNQAFLDEADMVGTEGTHDDQFDALAAAIARLAGSGGRRFWAV